MQKSHALLLFAFLRLLEGGFAAPMREEDGVDLGLGDPAMGDAGLIDDAGAGIHPDAVDLGWI